jgi:5'-3' exoribonuclease 1
MTTTYIDLLPEWGGYLTDKEKINPDRFESFLYHISVYEEEHFKRRGNEESEPGWKLSTENEEDDLDFYGTYYSGEPTPACAVEANFKGSYPPPSRLSSESAEGAVVKGPKGNRDFRRRHSKSQARSYRDFYYESKLGWKTEDRERTLFNRRAHVRDYLEGLHWNLNYYHNGCASWDWYFPHLYSPLATDMVNLNEFYNDDDESEEFRSFKFDPGEPFPSLGQLLSVLPPQSCSLLPPALGELMLSPSSPLIPYYPKDFKSDPNGKRQSWEGKLDRTFIDVSTFELKNLKFIIPFSTRKRTIAKKPWWICHLLTPICC